MTHTRKAHRFLARTPVPRWLKSAWNFLRTASGDDAYDRYLAHHMQAHAEQPALSRRAFYEEYQRQKWSGVSRCC